MVRHIERKSHVIMELEKFHKLFERRHDCRNTRLQSDGGGESVGCDTYLEDKGIYRSLIPQYSPDLNGMDERDSRTLMEPT